MKAGLAQRQPLVGLSCLSCRLTDFPLGPKGSASETFATGDPTILLRPCCGNSTGLPETTFQDMENVSSSAERSMGPRAASQFQCQVPNHKGLSQTSIRDTVGAGVGGILEACILFLLNKALSVIYKPASLKADSQSSRSSVQLHVCAMTNKESTSKPVFIFE